MQTIHGDITQVTSGIILHQVNCQNAMGSGVAKALYTKWPIIKTAFHEFSEFKTPESRLGKLQGVYITPTLIVVNSFSQLNYGNSYKTKIIYTNMPALISNINKAHKIAVQNKTYLYIPDHVGCGLAGGNWETLLSQIKHLENLIIVKLQP